MRLRRRWVGNETPHVNQQGVRERVQVEPEEIGEITVVAQPICLETALQFFVPILAFTAIRILLIGGGRHHFRSGPIAHDGAAIGALRVDLAFHRYPTFPRPGCRPIPKGTEQSLVLTCLLATSQSFVERLFTWCFEPRI